MATSKDNTKAIATIVVLLVVGYFVLKILPALLKKKSTTGSTLGGGVSGTNDSLYPYRQQQSSNPLGALGNALANAVKPPSNNGKPANYSMGSSNYESVASALKNGDYNANSANVLADIYNLQQGERPESESLSNYVQEPDTNLSATELAVQLGSPNTEDSLSTEDQSAIDSILNSLATSVDSTDYSSINGTSYNGSVDDSSTGYYDDTYAYTGGDPVSDGGDSGGDFASNAGGDESSEGY